ncbi:ATP-binding protein [Leucobacter sp. NPDC015123]|uniref:sensor histidine kinase n=1 Tax=Leucobacter sp. NPDC015123 TaxID=3364129 RepID=UPI0036F49E51
MRRRIVGIIVGFIVLAVSGLAAPLAVAIAERATATMAADRTGDAVRFAGIAESSIVSGEPGTIGAELARYEELFGIEAIVIDREGGIVASSREGLTPADLRGRELAGGGALPALVAYALAGTRTVSIDAVWPWTTERQLVAEPVVSGGEVVGAVVTASPTGALRVAISLHWLIVLLVIVALVWVGAAAAAPLARWVLRPIDTLEQATEDLGSGDLHARVPSGIGPPELVHLGRSFNRMATRIHSLVSRQRTFVAFAGHQVRNPLAALRMRIEGLGGALDSAAAEELALALEEVDRLTRTCDGLITLARADSHHPPVVDCEVKDVITRRVAGWLPIASRVGSSLEIGAVPSKLSVRAFEGTLDQALDALIDNALKFGARRVIVDARETAGPRERAEGSLGNTDVELRVRDNGPGLSEEDLLRAVEPFWRSPERSEEPTSPAASGSGLGLSVVVTLLGMQGGTLALTPISPSGTEAVLRLPVGQANGLASR